MADNSNTISGDTTGLAFILGRVVVALCILASFLLVGGVSVDQPDLRIELPNGAAIEGSAEGAMSE